MRQGSSRSRPPSPLISRRNDVPTTTAPTGGTAAACTRLCEAVGAVVVGTSFQHEISGRGGRAQQAEVVDRVVAHSGEMSLLALSVQVFGAPRQMALIPAGAFYPAPRVDSAVLRIDRYAVPAVPADLIPVLFNLARAGFQQRRKQLRNSLAAGLGMAASEADGLLLRAAIRPDRRAQELTLTEWERLAQALATVRGKDAASGGQPI